MFFIHGAINTREFFIREKLTIMERRTHDEIAIDVGSDFQDRVVLQSGTKLSQ